MTEDLTFEDRIEQFRAKVGGFNEQSDKEVVEQTAVRLEKLNYAPPVMIPVDSFLRLNRTSLLNEIENILQMPDEEACALAPDEPKKCQDLRVQFISVLIFYYEKLMRLRDGDPEEWDEIDELYVHD
jgi:hypothetical protein